MLSLSDCGVVAQIERLTKLPLVIPTRPSLQETRDYCFHSFRFPLISVPRTQPLSKLHQVDNIVLQSTCSDWTIFSLGLAEQYCIVRQSCNLLDCQTGRRAGRGVSGTTNLSLGTTCCIAKEQSVAVQSVSIMRARGEQGLVSTGGNPLHSLLHRTHMWIHCTKCDLLWKVRQHGPNSGPALLLPRHYELPRGSRGGLSSSRKGFVWSEANCQDANLKKHLQTEWIVNTS